VTTPELKKLGAELTELEKRAGIAEKVENAQLGPLFPDLDQSSEEYFKESEYLARRRVRKLYFSLEDAGVRKDLIRKRRECDRAAESYWQSQVAEARQKVEAAQREANSLPWTQAGGVAVLCVAVGAYFFHIYGAIAGGLMGFFLAQGMLAHERSFRGDAERTARAELEEMLKTTRENEATPDWFNASEERSGERDENFDRESVFNPRQRGA
jgi:hypothetical protein